MSDAEHVPAVVLVTAPGSRLEQLQASYESAKAARDEAVARFDALTGAIKAELASASQGNATDIILSGGPALPQLRMVWKAPYRFDAKRFRAEHPDIYVRYEVRGGHWDLRVIS